jgi:hypothetical protein
MRRRRRISPLGPMAGIVGVRRVPVSAGGNQCWRCAGTCRRAFVSWSEELLSECGVDVDHVTLFRWGRSVITIVIDVADRSDMGSATAGSSMKPTSRVASVWRYVYGTTDHDGTSTPYRFVGRSGRARPVLPRHLAAHRTRTPESLNDGGLGERQCDHEHADHDPKRVGQEDTDPSDPTCRLEVTGRQCPEWSDRARPRRDHVRDPNGNIDGSVPSRPPARSFGIRTLNSLPSTSANTDTDQGEPDHNGDPLQLVFDR